MLVIWHGCHFGAPCGIAPPPPVSGESACADDMGGPAHLAAQSHAAIVDAVDVDRLASEGGEGAQGIAPPVAEHG